MIDAATKYDAIMKALDAGKTVYVRTMTRTTAVKAKHVQAWEKAGRPLFKVSGRSLYMGAGKRYDCIDYCVLEVA